MYGILLYDQVARRYLFCHLHAESWLEADRQVRKHKPDYHALISIDYFDHDDPQFLPYAFRSFWRVARPR